MENLLGQGLELALFGMGTVFVFLTLLIGATTVMSNLAMRFADPADSTVAAPVGLALGNQPLGTSDPQLIAVITAAISVHRSRQ